NPNWQVISGTDRAVVDTLIKEGLIKEFKNKELGTYLKTKANISFSYEISNNARFEINDVKFIVEIK
ncbi:MAG: hypothetical protein ACRC0G_01605, partial [Fusobacteriaceae bacterium]